ncbi:MULTISPECIES: DDE-type integrase/transposase/recombinase [unclassified Commensalibacter]|uniref:DDE-type integrase/transposase/recombinase n=1 Tax=unclassified Commensalibacter TaxID=2630218 RepID=UPI00351C3E03
MKAAQRFFRKAFKEDSMFVPTYISTDKALTFPKTIQTMKNKNILPDHCFHETKKFLQRGIENDHFRLKRVIPKNGCFQSFHTARKTPRGYEAILWIKKELGFKGKWIINEQINFIQNMFGLNNKIPV